jgi:hypothetical protein
MRHSRGLFGALLGLPLVGAFGLWLALSWIVRRLRVPAPPLVAATLSWIVAWLCIQALPIVLHEIGSWPMH